MVLTIKQAMHLVNIANAYLRDIRDKIQSSELKSPHIELYKEISRLLDEVANQQSSKLCDTKSSTLH